MLVIGAGPHSLSLCCRLLEQFPDSLTDAQHSRVLENVQRRKPHGSRKDLGSSPSATRSRLFQSLRVVDRYGCWMEQWRRQFDGLDIAHLRSPVFLHPDPCVD